MVYKSRVYRFRGGDGVVRRRRNSVRGVPVGSLYPGSEEEEQTE